MKKTIYYMSMPDKNVYYIGDKLLRIISIIFHTLEFLAIIYLLCK